jgi:branched-chain amino acid aminotransferase
MDNEPLKDTGNSFTNSIFPLEIYEVIRVVKGIPLFFEEHIDRLYQSARIAEINVLPGPIIVSDNLSEFISKKNLITGNIKISFYFESATGAPMQSTEILPHNYPTYEQYKKGICVSSMQAERILPNAKIQQTDVRDKANKIISETGIWEVLLLDKHGFITEGSRTNIFFVKGSTLVTPPPEKVLQGTTRKKIIKICIENNIPISEEAVHYTNLFTFDSAFLTGTSPKILPISNIDEQVFTSDNAITKQICDLYDKMIEEYIISKR